MATLTETRPSRGTRLRPPLLLGAGLGAATLALHLRDPHASGSWGLCPFNFITGLQCPGCGGLRAVNDLTNFDLVGALSSNLVVVLGIPLAVLLWLRWVRDAWVGAPVTGPSQGLSTPVVAVLLGTVLVFGVLRNLPFGAWLAP
ncbi:MULTISPECIES: DUF2752 domain-containing protein [unclassified Nocardioides]|uniref:DUF2752 domain-containing protein n=1 Tax=unclassified Nocardioides TaxID=2615069 RepID=UPI0006F55064|nr:MULTISPECIES: DUF2752 domain-containing protein [unclassified Nocardioides]KQY64019.1 hypothetical protein ASD30_03350 [Nocardioides sp. Root140]KQZ69939.1 hypothetical protein ASD66_09595 [Nocardioides sp. Root151]KRF16032.1 hypothetical protein ASH02_05355 [Nocardioides sp. Soil796]